MWALYFDSWVMWVLGRESWTFWNCHVFNRLLHLFPGWQQFREGTWIGRRRLPAMALSHSRPGSLVMPASAFRLRCCPMPSSLIYLYLSSPVHLAQRTEWGGNILLITALVHLSALAVSRWSECSHSRLYFLVSCSDSCHPKDVAAADWSGSAAKSCRICRELFHCLQTTAGFSLRFFIFPGFLFLHPWRLRLFKMTPSAFLNIKASQIYTKLCYSYVTLTTATPSVGC